MKALEIYTANKDTFIEKINNKIYITLGSLNFDYGKLIGMLSILMLSDNINCKKYNEEVAFLDHLVLNYLPRKEVLK